MVVAVHDTRPLNLYLARKVDAALPSPIPAILVQPVVVVAAFVRVEPHDRLGPPQPIDEPTFLVAPPPIDHVAARHPRLLVFILANVEQVVIFILDEAELAADA